MYARRSPPRKLPQGVTLREHETSGQDVFRRGKPGEIRMKRYHVLLDGVVIGEVYQDRTTFERKTPGRVYVNARWENVRWHARRSPVGRSYYTYYETRLDAVLSLVGAHERALQEAKAREPA